MRMAWTTILYNEEKNISKAFYSIKDCIDCIIVGIDEKTTDNTLGILSELAEQYRISFNYYSHNTDKGYSIARNVGVKWAEQLGHDFVFILDGDEYLKTGSAKVINKILEWDSGKYEFDSIVSTMIGTSVSEKFSVSAPTIRMFRSKYRYKYRMHEHPDIPDGSSAYVPDIITINDKHPEDRIVKSNKNRCEQLLLDLIDYPKASEQMFNLGMEYMAQKEFKNALRYLNQALSNKLATSMVYMAHLKIARCYKKLSKSEKQYNTLMGLTSTHPHRAEHLVEIGAFFIERESYFNALLVLCSAVNVSKPTTSEMGIDSHYGIIPWKLLLVVFDNIKYKDGIKNIKDIIKKLGKD